MTQDPKEALDAPTIDAPGEKPLLESRYQLGPLLARGGMGEVFEGWDRVENRAVAIKQLSKLCRGDPIVRQRFLQEAMAMKRLAHPHIIPVYAAGTHNGAPYLVMEHLQGQTLADRVRAPEPLSHQAVVKLGRQLLSAIAHVHQVGLIHRDIKPSNIMVKDEHLTLLDFGIVKDEHTHLTATGATVGTPDFMAPEQARDPRSADARSDLYSAGATLFTTWTGLPPFSGPSAFEIQRYHHEAPIPKATARRPELPKAVDRFCQRALAKSPSERFEDADAMQSALVALLEPARSRPPIGWAYRSALWPWSACWGWPLKQNVLNRQSVTPRRRKALKQSKGANPRKQK